VVAIRQFFMWAIACSTTKRIDATWALKRCSSSVSFRPDFSLMGMTPSMPWYPESGIPLIARRQLMPFALLIGRGVPFVWTALLPVLPIVAAVAIAPLVDAASPGRFYALLAVLGAW
jgi:hypothetical protein